MSRIMSRSRAASFRQRPSRRPALSPRARARAIRVNARLAKRLPWRPPQRWLERILGRSAVLSPIEFVDALQSWQQTHGLEPDGVIGADTVQAMRAEPDDSPPAGDDLGEPEEPETHYTFRQRRRCNCPKCASERAAKRPCTCDVCKAEREENESWLDTIQGWFGSPAMTPPANVNRKSKEYIRWYQSALNKIQNAGLSVDGVAGSNTRAAVRVFQANRGLTPDGIVGPQTEAALIEVGAGNPPAAAAGSGSSVPKGSHAAVNTPLPRSASGLLPYKPQSRQYGVKETIDALIAIGQRWPSGRPRIRIGDISLQGGGKMDGHASHQLGLDIDIGLMRSDGVESGTTYKERAYSRSLTQELVNLIRANGILRVQYIFFNDPQVTGVSKWPNHDNHLHVRFYPPSTSGETSTCTCDRCRRGLTCGCSHRDVGNGEENFLGDLFGGWLNPTRTVDYPIDRKSKEYIRWYQDAVNKLAPANLAVDGINGDKTKAAVRTFQAKAGIAADGVVGAQTEAALLKAGAPMPPRAAGGTPSTPVAPASPCGPSPTLSNAERDALAATSTLEGGKPFHCLVSKTDGISMGAIQWNLKAGTLQTILNKFESRTGRLATFFGADTPRLKRLIDLKQTPKNNAVAEAKDERLAERWRDPLTRVCGDPDFCALQQEDIAGRICTAWNSFVPLGLTTVRGLCMVHDIAVGDGGGALRTVRERALASAGWFGLSEAAKLERLANIAADRLSTYREERRARRKNLANIPTPYRGSPGTRPKSWADIINKAVPNLDRALTTAERTACGGSGGGSGGGGRAVTPSNPVTPPAAGERSCPAPAQTAACGLKCDPIPDLICLRAINGVPLNYLSAFDTSVRPQRGISAPNEFKMRPKLRDALRRFLTEMTSAGIAVEQILSQGATLCRCIAGKNELSDHSKGEAIDIGGVRLAAPLGRESLAINFTDSGERPLIRRINACLRLAFPTVLDYNYNSAHHNHFHCDFTGGVRAPKSRSTVLFVQEALSFVLGRSIAVDGSYGSQTEQALRDFGASAAELASTEGLNAVYDRLFRKIAKATS